MASIRIADRLQKDNEFISKKMGVKKKIKDKDPLFNDYDPDNSLLNVRIRNEGIYEYN